MTACDHCGEEVEDLDTCDYCGVSFCDNCGSGEDGCCDDEDCVAQKNRRS